MHSRGAKAGAGSVQQARPAQGSHQKQAKASLTHKPEAGPTSAQGQKSQQLKLVSRPWQQLGACTQRDHYQQPVHIEACTAPSGTNMQMHIPLKDHEHYKQEVRVHAGTSSHTRLSLMHWCRHGNNVPTSHKEKSLKHGASEP